VRQFFKTIGFQASSDIVELFRALGGMSQMDNEYWRMWSLEEISATNQQTSEAGLLFADYCLDCYQYRFKPISASAAEVWVEGFDSGPPVRISCDLSDFFEAYITKPDSILNAPTRAR
jgi:hypothetical protein